MLWPNFVCAILHKHVDSAKDSWGRITSLPPGGFSSLYSEQVTYKNVISPLLQRLKNTAHTQTKPNPSPSLLQWMGNIHDLMHLSQLEEPENVSSWRYNLSWLPYWVAHLFQNELAHAICQWIRSLGRRATISPWSLSGIPALLYGNFVIQNL